ncbi:hypothetical protein JCM6882_004369 [Rhodosporidiobolus microsporus]
MSAQTDPEECRPQAKGEGGRRGWLRVAACCMSAGSLGWHDACGGPLIPDIQARLALDYTQVSLIFIGSFIGYLVASLLNVALVRRFGLAKVFALGAALQICGCVALAAGLPFVPFVTAYGLAGLGLALQDAQLNTHISGLANSSAILGVAHALYGLSGMVAPIVATALLERRMPFYAFYYTNLAWSILTAIAVLIGFNLWSPTGVASLPQVDERAPLLPERPDVPVSISVVLRSRAVVAALVFVVLYVGSEIGEAGWIASFLLHERGGGVRSGWGTAAFFAGITTSRVLLLPINRLLGEKRAVTVYIIIAAAAQVVVWVVRDYWVDLSAVLLFGFAFGPMYPIAISLVTKSTPQSYHSAAVGLMACLGQAGSAFFPFVVGALSERFGVAVLQPVQLVLAAVMLAAWLAIPGATSG